MTIDDLDALPTTPDIFHDDANVGYVIYEVDGFDVSFKIIFDQKIYEMDYTFRSDMDMTLFEDNYQSILFYT